MSRLRSFSLIIAYGAGFSGFYFFILGVLALGYGDNTRMFSVPFRIGFLGFSVIFVALSIYRRSLTSLGWLWIPLLTFWMLYFLRIALDGYLVPVPLGQPPIEYLQMSIGVVFIPMFIFLDRLRLERNRLAFRAFFSVHVLCMIAVFIVYKDILGESYRALKYSGYDANELISPITISYIGALAVVIGVQFFFKENTAKIGILDRLVFLAIIATGGFLLNIGGTRSALLACISVVALILWKSQRKQRKKKVLIAIVGVLIAVFIGTSESMMSNRFMVLAEQLNTGSAETGGGRLAIYRDGLTQFLNHPLLGSGLEEKNVMFYPHNHILEAFMATGMIGGLCFLIISYWAIRRSLNILRHHPDFGWIACLFLVFYLRGLFSGSIIEPTLWYSMMCVFAVFPVHQIKDD